MNLILMYVFLSYPLVFVLMWYYKVWERYNKRIINKPTNQLRVLSFVPYLFFMLSPIMLISVLLIVCLAFIWLITTKILKFAFKHL